MTHRIIDISSNNAHPIDWQKVKASGIDAAMIKATQGTNYVNEYFISDIKDATTTTLQVAAYHYANFTDARAEAAFFERIAGRYAKILDTEASTNATWINEFLAALGEPSNQVMDYGSAASLPWGTIRGLVWVAAWGPIMPKENETLWQYTDRALVPGITGFVDESLWTGTEDQYNAFFGITPVSVSNLITKPPTTPKENEMEILACIVNGHPDFLVYGGKLIALPDINTFNGLVSSGATIRHLDEPTFLWLTKTYGV